MHSKLPIRLQEQFAELIFNKHCSHATLRDLIFIVNDVTKYVQTKEAQQVFKNM